MNKPSSLALTQIADSNLRGWLRGRRGTLVLLGLAAVAALAFGWYSLGFAAIAPIFYLLPCAAMMAMCAKGMGHGDGQSQSGRACAAGTTNANDQAAKPPAALTTRHE